MPKAYYIDYKTMKDFYTLKDVADLLFTTRPAIKRLCYRYGIELKTNSENKVGLPQTDMRELHYIVYWDTHKVNAAGRDQIRLAR